jgi:hypothetical protein
MRSIHIPCSCGSNSTTARMTAGQSDMSWPRYQPSPHASATPRIPREPSSSLSGPCGCDSLATLYSHPFAAAQSAWSCRRQGQLHSLLHRGHALVPCRAHDGFLLLAALIHRRWLLRLHLRTLRACFSTMWVRARAAGRRRWRIWLRGAVCAWGRGRA